MSPLPLPARSGFTRRTLLAASAAGLSVLAVGCTAEPADPREQVTSEQADELAAQVAVQEALVAAFTAAGAADPAWPPRWPSRRTRPAQLDRLKAAAPGRTASAAASPAPPRRDPRPRRGCGAGRRHGDSHATACLDQSGARAALLGSIAAGLRGQDAVLA